MLERLNSLWVGGEVGCIEQLCLASARACGHPFTLYSYTPDNLRGLPDGVEVRDAKEVMSNPKLTRYFEIGRGALGSDFFRYALLAKNVGYWVDMDCYFLKPLDFVEPYVFGWENTRTINGAVLKLPSPSEMLSELLALPKDNWRPPFFGPKRTLQFHLSRLINGNIKPEHLPWGSFGPAIITYFARKYHTDAFAQSTPVFYPVSYDESEALFDNHERVEEMIKPETRVVHLWHSKLKGRIEGIRKESYLGLVCRRYDIDFVARR